MKMLNQILAVAAAGVIMTGAVKADDKSASHQDAVTTTNAVNPFSLQLKSAPEITVGSNWRASGLAVDLLQPEQTWELFDPAVPAPVQSKPEPVVPVTLVRADSGDDNLALHDAHFVFLKLSFP